MITVVESERKKGLHHLESSFLISHNNADAVWGSILKWTARCLLIFFLSALGFPGYAQEANPSVEKQDEKRLLILPYPFFNDTIGSGVGAAVIAEGYVQKQMLTVGTALGSSEGTYLFFLMVRNYQFPWIKRLILDPQTSIGEFQEIKSYTRDSPDFPEEDAIVQLFIGHPF